MYVEKLEITFADKFVPTERHTSMVSPVLHIGGGRGERINIVKVIFLYTYQLQEMNMNTFIYSVYLRVRIPSTLQQGH